MVGYITTGVYYNSNILQYYIIRTAGYNNIRISNGAKGRARVIYDIEKKKHSIII